MSIINIIASGYFAVTGYGNIFYSLAVGSTGKARFGVTSKLHWEGSIRR